MSYESEILKRIGNRSLTKDVDETIYFGFPQYVLPNPWEELSEKDARKSNYFLELVNYSVEGVECRGWQWWTFFTLEITGGCNLNPNKANENSDNK